MPSTCGGRNDTQKDGERRSEAGRRRAALEELLPSLGSTFT